MKRKSKNHWFLWIWWYVKKLVAILMLVILFALVVIGGIVVIDNLFPTSAALVLNEDYISFYAIPEEVEEDMQVLERRRYDIPLSAELQDFTFDTAKEHGVEFELVLAIMWAESDFRVDVVSKTLDYGLMQINRVNHERLRYALGRADFLDARDNIRAGVYMLSEISSRHSYLYRILMVYNMGEVGARRTWERGEKGPAVMPSLLAPRLTKIIGCPS